MADAKLRKLIGQHTTLKHTRPRRCSLYTKAAYTKAAFDDPAHHYFREYYCSLSERYEYGSHCMCNLYDYCKPWKVLNQIRIVGL